MSRPLTLSASALPPIPARERRPAVSVPLAGRRAIPLAVLLVASVALFCIAGL